MIALSFDNATGQGDLAFDGGIVQGYGLETSIAISLLTWRRATKDDSPPDGMNLLGFWGDTYPDVPGDLIGSRLWLMAGKKINQESLTLAVDLTREALQWLIDDGVAESIEPVATRGTDDKLQIGAWIKKPTELASKWYSIWEGTIGS